MYAFSRRWGMYLESPGEIFEQYAQSILSLFSDVTSRRYLKLIWSSQTMVSDDSDKRID